MLRRPLLLERSKTATCSFGLLSLLIIHLLACSSQQQLQSQRQTIPTDAREIAANWQPLFPFRESFNAPRLAALVRKAIGHNSRNNTNDPGVTDPQAARLALAASIARHWFDAVEARQQLELARRAMDVYLQAIKNIREGYRAGTNSIQELKQAKSILIDAKRLLATWQERQEQARQALHFLLGDSFHHRPALPKTLPDLNHPIPANLPAALLRRRTDLIAAEKRLLKTDEPILNAAKNWLSGIHLTDSNGTVSRELSRMLSEDYLFSSLMDEISSPTTPGGHPRQPIPTGIRQAITQYVQVVLKAFHEVETALTEADRLTAQERTLQRRINEAETGKQRSVRRYRGKQQNSVRILEKQRQLFNAKSTLLAIRNQRLQNRIDLHMALGGGFTPPMQADR